MRYTTIRCMIDLNKKFVRKTKDCVENTFWTGFMSPLELEGFGVTIGDYVINRIKKYFNSSPTEHQKKKH